MVGFEVVAHRGMTDNAPENTIPAFQKAIELGADAVEFDVRLTKDGVPVLFHYFYLHVLTNLEGAIFNYTYQQLCQARYILGSNQDGELQKVLTLREVLEAIGGRVGLEIEIKGPEPEAPKIIGKLLREYRSLWSCLEITSYEPQLLLAMQTECQGIPADLLIPKSESWMGLDVVAYTTIHRARLAGARAVHLHPNQLSEELVSTVRQAGIDIHAWDVNDESSLDLVVEYGIPRVCTDSLEQATTYRARIDA
jgi:glycerophosphoryl diester phosphodiesterase